MDITEKIKTLREANDLSQEKMAQLMNMSKNGYGKLERGEVEITVRKLKKIASILNVDISELINEKGVFYHIGDIGDNSNNHNCYNSNIVKSDKEYDILKEIISAKNELIENLKQENERLKKRLALYENN